MSNSSRRRLRRTCAECFEPPAGQFVAEPKLGDLSLKQNRTVVAPPSRDTEARARARNGPPLQPFPAPKSVKHTGLALNQCLLRRPLRNGCHSRGGKNRLRRGMAQSGNPSDRLAKDTLAIETDIIAHLGGRFLFGQHLGRDFDVDEVLARGDKAVFLGLGVPGGLASGRCGRRRGVLGYHSGIDFLLMVHDHVDGTAPLSVEGVAFKLTAVMGPSGCAKSTLAARAAGLPERGRGRVVRESARRAVAFQDPALLRWKTALDKAGFALLAEGPSHGERWDLALVSLAQVGLAPEARETYPGQLSGGMRPRASRWRPPPSAPGCRENWSPKAFRDQLEAKLDSKRPQHQEVPSVSRRTGGTGLS